MEVKRDILWRVYLAYLAVVLICTAIVVKAFYIQQVEGAYWRNMSDSLHLKIQDVDADRGTIYSTNGQMLSTSVPQFDVYVDFAADGLRENNGKLFHENLDSLSYCLSTLFKDRTVAGYKQLLLQGYKKRERYYLLKRKVGFEEFRQLRSFPLVRLGKNKSGFIAESRSIRLNPYQLLAFRTIGLDRQNAQKVGLEQTYDTVLSGSKGKRLVRYISGGVAVPVEDDNRVEPENGKDIITTIDTRIQEIAENALLGMMQQSSSVSGTCVVMETATGKIRAIANLGAKADGSYWEDYNYALRTTEPGSTIKLATLLAVLSEGSYTINNMVETGTSGSAYVGVRNVNDAERSPRPVMSVKECFAHSSNVGMSRIAYNTFATKPDVYRQYLHQFRLDTITGIDLNGEEKPVIRKLKPNKEGLHLMVTMSFGYALEVSPLQTLMLYNAVANDGKMMKPYLVEKIQSEGSVIREFTPTVLSAQLCAPEVIAAARECMEAVTTEGTAKNVFKNAKYAVAGKTGTAHVSDGNYEYSAGIYQASFVGYFPADKPQYSCIVVIRTKPHAALHYGGQLAAPVFKTIADRLYAFNPGNNNQHAAPGKNDSLYYLYAGSTSDIRYVLSKTGVPYRDSSVKDAEWAIISKGADRPMVKAETVTKATMPQLAGMALKDAVYLCESMGLRVLVKGKGKVAAQSLAAGQPIVKGQPVALELN